MEKFRVFVSLFVDLSDMLGLEPEHITARAIHCVSKKLLTFKLSVSEFYHF